MERDESGARRGPYRKGVAQRTRLIAAAMSAFERRGGDLSLADVAEAAGVSREAVRHYFATVNDLLLALQGEYDARNAQLSADDEALPERVAAAVRSAYGSRGSAALTALLTARAVIDGESAVSRAMRERSARLRDALTAAVRRAQDTGEFRDDIEAPVLARLLLAATQASRPRTSSTGSGRPAPAGTRRRSSVCSPPRKSGAADRGSPCSPAARRDVRPGRLGWTRHRG